jgi:regulator of protease activity HflC (stomatin/prohibitin superfamily)
MNPMTPNPMIPVKTGYTNMPARIITPKRVPNPIAPVAFLAIVGASAIPLMTAGPGLAATISIGAGLLLGTIMSRCIKIAAQWEKAIIFRLGRFVGTREAGIYFLAPFIDTSQHVDCRIQTLDIPHRQAITKDNVPVRIDGVIFMHVNDPSAAIIRVQNYIQAVLEYAQTALRDIVGGMTLDQILADRELLGKRVEEMVEAEIAGWGLDVAAIRIQDIELPEDLKRVMARQASAEREKRATITKAEGDRDAAANLAEAARVMAECPGALQLRTLQTIDGLGPNASNTVILALPIELTQALGSVPKLADALGGGKKKDE